MEYRSLGETDLKVSSICLGTMTFGEQNSAEEAAAQLDRALAAGLIAVASALATSGLLRAVGAYNWAELRETYLLFLPLMFFPEAVLNGWTMSILVGFKPEWVHTFRDEEYLDGK